MQNQAKMLSNEMIPASKNVKAKLVVLSKDIELARKHINSNLNYISDKLRSFHIGQTISGYVATAIICLIIGILSCLFIMMQFD